jgi:hypothetical protein
VIAEWYKIPILVSLGVIVALLGGSVIASMLRPPAAAPLPVHPPHKPDDTASPGDAASTLR